MANSYIVRNCYFKLALTEKTFYQDINADYTCKELYEKVLPNVNRYLMDRNDGFVSIDQFEIIPVRNTENGIGLPKIDACLYEVIHKDDMESFYIKKL